MKNNENSSKKPVAVRISKILGQGIKLDKLRATTVQSDSTASFEAILEGNSVSVRVFKERLSQSVNERQ